MREIKNVITFYKRGVVLGGLLVGGILVSAEMTACAVEIGLVNAGKRLSVRFDLVSRGLGEEGRCDLVYVAGDKVFICR